MMKNSWRIHYQLRLCHFYMKSSSAALAALSLILAFTSKFDFILSSFITDLEMIPSIIQYKLNEQIHGIGVEIDNGDENQWISERTSSSEF